MLRGRTHRPLTQLPAAHCISRIPKAMYLAKVSGNDIKDSRSISLLCKSIVHYGVRLAWICGDIGLNIHIIGFLQNSQVSISPSKPKYKQHNDMKDYQGPLFRIQHHQRPKHKQPNSHEMSQTIATSKGVLRLKNVSSKRKDIPSIPNEHRQEPLYCIYHSSLQVLGGGESILVRKVMKTLAGVMPICSASEC